MAGHFLSSVMVLQRKCQEEWDKVRKQMTIVRVLKVSIFEFYFNLFLNAVMHKLWAAPASFPVLNKFTAQ